MPSISVEGDISELVSDPELVETLEQCVIHWLGQISYALDSQMKKKPQVFCAEGLGRSQVQVTPSTPGAGLFYSFCWRLP